MDSGSDALLLAEVIFVVAVPVLLYGLHRKRHVFDGVRPSGALLGLLTLMYYVDALPFVWENCPDDPEIGTRYLGVVLVMFGGVAAGIVLSDVIVRRAPVGGTTWRVDLDKPAFGNTLIFGGIFLSLSAVAAYHFVASRGYTTIVEFASFEGDPWFLSDLREAVNQDRPGTYATNLARFAVLPPLALATVSYALTKRTPGSIMLAVGSWGGVLVSRLATLHKAPATFWLLGVVLMWSTFGRVRRPMRVMAFGIAGAAALMVFLYGFIYGQGWREGWAHTVQRTTSIPQGSVLLYLRTFPDLHDHLYGSSISFVQRLSGQSVVVPSYVPIMERWHLGGTPNAGFIGDGWADFGWFGVVALSVLAGLTVRILESIVLAMPRTPLFHGCYVGIVLSAVNLSSVSYWTTLLTHGLALGPIVVFAIWALRGRTPLAASRTALANAGAQPRPKFGSGSLGLGTGATSPRQR